MALLLFGLSGSARAATVAATLSVNNNTTVNAFNVRYLYGSNSVLWMNASRFNNVRTQLQQSGTYFVRGLGGSFSDTYHWNGNGSYDADGVWHCDDTVWTKGFTVNMLYDASKVYDGNVSSTSQWRSTTETASAWVWASLASAASIDQVRLDWGSPYAVDYKIQVWKGASYGWAPHESMTDGWVTVLTVTGGTGGTDIRAIPATSGTVWRVLMTASSGQGYRLNEVELDGGGAKKTISNAAACPTSGANQLAANFWGGNFETFMAYVQSLGPQAVPLITVNVGTGTPEEAAAWVHYANVVKGYGIEYWEIGNEMAGAWEAGGPLNADDYAQRYIRFAEAMRAVDPSIKIYGPTNGLDTASEQYDGYTYAERFLQVLAGAGKLGLLTGLSHHEYPDYANTNATTSMTTTSRWPGWKTFVEGLYNTYCGGPQAKELLMSEYNSGSATQAMCMQVPNALWVADWLGQFVTAFGPRAKTTMWDILNGTIATGEGEHALFDAGNLGAPYTYQARPDYWALYMMNQYFSVQDEAGNTLVSAATNQSLLKAYADRRSDGKLSLLVINESPANAYAAAVSVSGFNVSPSAQVATWGDFAQAPYYVDNWNWVGTAATPYADLDLSPTVSSIGFAGNSFAFTFAPYSLTVIQCLPLGSPTPSPTASPTRTATPTASPSATPSPSPTASPSRSATPTASPSATPPPTATASPSATQSPTPLDSKTPTPSPSVSDTPPGTLTTTPTATLSQSPVDTATPTTTSSASGTPSVTLTQSATPTDTETATPTASATPTPTTTESPVASATRSATTSPSATGSATPASTATRTATRTDTPLATPTSSGTPMAGTTLTPTPSSFPSAGPDNPLRLTDAAPMPQPNPRRLLFKIEGRADRASLAVYSPAMVLLLKLDWQGSWQDGWNAVDLPADLLDKVGPGQRFGLLRIAGGGREALERKSLRLYLTP